MIHHFGKLLIGIVFLSIMEVFDKTFLSKIETVSPNLADVDKILYNPLFDIMNKSTDSSEEFNEKLTKLSTTQLEEFLYGMWYWLKRSKGYWFHRIKYSLQKHSQPTGPAIQERLFPLILKQELVYLMSLIEVLPKLSENRLRIACNFINQLFVENPALIKEIHRPEHLYDKEIIPVLVSNVPSMHAALDSAIKLFNSRPIKDAETDSYIDLESFGALLVAELSIMYPNQKSYDACNNIVDKISENEGLSSVLEKIITAFPNLNPKISEKIKNWSDEATKRITDRIKFLSNALQNPDNLIYYPDRFR